MLWLQAHFKVFKNQITLSLTQQTGSGVSPDSAHEPFWNMEQSWIENLTFSKHFTSCVYTWGWDVAQWKAKIRVYISSFNMQYSENICMRKFNNKNVNNCETEARSPFCSDFLSGDFSSAIKKTYNIKIWSCVLLSLCGKMMSQSFDEISGGKQKPAESR